MTIIVNRRQTITELKVTALLLAISLAACGSDRADTLVPDLENDVAASLLAATAGMTNVAVTESNRQEVCQEMFRLFVDSYERAVEQAMQIQDTRAIRILGNVNGYAMSDSNLMPVTMPMKYLESRFRLVLHNYSNSGRLYIGGQINLEGLSWKKDSIWRTVYLFVDTSISSALEFAGVYRGNATLNRFPIAFDDFGNMLDVRGNGPFPSGAPVRLTSGGQTMEFDPYARNAPADSSGADSSRVDSSSPGLL